MKIFNASLEMGMKALLMLKVIGKQEISLERIVFYDSFTYKNMDQQERQLNKFLRRASYQEGINLMLSKDLLDIRFTELGIFYQSNSQTIMFVNLLESNYAQVSKGDKKIVVKYEDYSDVEIQQIKQ